MLRAGYQGVMTVNTTQTLTRPATPRGAVRRPEHPAVIAGTRPRPSASAGDVIQAYLRVHVHTLTSLESAVRADEYDSVHQMRVAVRRLRATLRTFDQVIPHVDSEHLDTELQWLGRVLGHARDAEVLAGHLRDSLRPTPPELLIGPVLARVQGHYAPRRADARAALLEALDSPRYARLLARQAARDLGIGAHLAGENAFTYGLLYEHELHRAEQRQADARRAWKRASRPRRRRWMNQGSAE